MSGSTSKTEHIATKDIGGVTQKHHYIQEVRKWLLVRRALHAWTNRRTHPPADLLRKSAADKWTDGEAERYHYTDNTLIFSSMEFTRRQLEL